MCENTPVVIKSFSHGLKTYIKDLVPLLFSFSQDFNRKVIGQIKLVIDICKETPERFNFNQPKIRDT